MGNNNITVYDNYSDIPINVNKDLNANFTSIEGEKDSTQEAFLGVDKYDYSIINVDELYNEETDEITDKISVKRSDYEKYLDFDGLQLLATNKNTIDKINQDEYPNGKSSTGLSKDEGRFIRFPEYSAKDYIETINNWRKQIDPFASQGFFYFKIFFNFDTNYGLLGGVKNRTKSINTALGYLSTTEYLKLYDSENLSKRKESLIKFINHLSYISNETPWFFKEISSLNNIRSSYVTEDDFKENYLNILCLPDSVDMRLTTLFDLYKFACYDNIRNKEIIPSNLRKFEMSILFFHMPLRKYHTPFILNNDKTFNKFKTTRDIIQSENYNNVMSFKMYTFQNCEFDVNSMNNFGNDSVSNESPFTLGGNTIKITYDRVYEHMFNEFEHILVGQNIYKEFKEENIDDRFKKISIFLKNSYEKPSYNDFADVGQNLYGNATNIHSKYYVDKIKNLRDGTIDSGNIYEADYGRFINESFARVNTQYLNEKLRRIKEGGDLSNIPDTLAHQNSFKLKWTANAIKNSSNMYKTDGIPTTKNTWGGKLLEATWQRTKAEFSV